MKFLLILFCLITLPVYFLGHVTFNKREAHGLARVVISLAGGLIISLAGGLIFTLIIGLPLLGVLALFGFIWL